MYNITCIDYTVVHTYKNYMYYLIWYVADVHCSVHVLILCGGLGSYGFEGGSFSSTDLAILR